MDLENFFSKKQIISLKSTEKQVIIKELIQKLESLELIKNADRYYAQVIHRESLENTGIGKGLAIPHARTESVDKFITILGLCPDGIDYQSFDNVPVRYVLLSIFPTEMSTKYLYMVGMFSKIFLDDEKVIKIDEARTPAKIYTILNREAKTYFSTIADADSEKADADDSLTGVPSSDLDLIIRLDRLYHIFDEGDNSESITKKISEIRELIDNKSLSYYEKMRKKHQNPFSVVEKETCTGCHMRIPPIHINQTTEKNQVWICTHCGRFLIFI